MALLWNYLSLRLNLLIKLKNILLNNKSPDRLLQKEITMNIKKIVCYILWLTGILFCSTFCAASSEHIAVPADLSEWKSWVLHNEEKQLCPTNYNNGQIHVCYWPSAVELYIEPDGGSFKQKWLVFARGWVPIPGGKKLWPREIKLNGEKAPVVSRNNIPHIRLEKGEHEVTGKFQWVNTPEIIKIPPEAGILKLFIDGKKIDFPIMDKSGRLWLQKQAASKDQPDRLDVKIYRLVKDTIPMKVNNLIKINISGKAREIMLDGVFLENSVPMNLKSPIPARIGSRGELLIQARPGRWEISITTRFKKNIEQIGPVQGKFGLEIWTFQAENSLRMVKIESVPGVEPGRTDMPQNWKKFPAYLVKPGAEVIFNAIRRGDPEPAPDQLNINRTWWLDFNGKGFTILDHITGTMSSNWYLSMNHPEIPGRITVDGEDRLIIACGKNTKPGVEVRRGQLDLTAVSRLNEPAGSIPAVGWDHNFKSATGTLNLPPGWKLLHATGMDVLPGTWFQRWTLLDLFLVLIISIAVYKIRNPAWGGIALITMALIYHESGAPHMVWLSLLAAYALINVLPDGWFKKIAVLWYVLSIISLLVISIPFMVQQIKCGFYPQLERVGQVPGFSDRLETIDELAESEPYQKAGALKSREKSYTGLSSKAMVVQDQAARKRLMLEHDPDALIQTGPGRPSWRWRSIGIRWNGPVEKNQSIRLWLLSPVTNLMLAILRVILLALFMVGVINIGYWRSKSFKGKYCKSAAIAACLLLFSVISDANTQNGCYPSPELLEELKERLLEQPDCLPYCADCTAMELRADPEHLTIVLNIAAACRTAIPLPVTLKSWNPEQILLDQKPVAALARDSEGLLWILVPKGVHIIVLAGKPGPDDIVRIPLPLTPHKVSLINQGWNIQGVDKNGNVESSIKLTRLKKNGHKISPAGESVIQPFFNIKRILRLGLTWQVDTTIKRLTPAGVPVIVSVPLIDGESVTTAGISVRDKRALINMGSNTKTIQWSSTLAISPEITLSAPQSVPWTESWILDASPIWHCDLSGIPIIHHQSESGVWRPEWSPWPGEKVTLKVSRPKAIPGRMVTIDKAALNLIPGRRFNKSELVLQIRSSKGGQHKIILPGEASLQLVKIGRDIQPVRQVGQEVTIPLKPGAQKIYYEWHQPAKSLILLKGPLVKTGDQAVNAGMTFKMPQNRWILWTHGPRLGPAVLFWSYIFIVVLFSFALGKITLTPLKTHQWLLLGLGLTQVPAFIAVMIVGWLLALGLRKKNFQHDNWFKFNLVQLLIACLTIAALSGLYMAIKNGLLGIPDMQIRGNHSNSFNLHWTQDRIGSTMPCPWVLSLPLIVYHILMLLWSLWLAFSLLKWLRWGWDCFSEGGLWQKMTFRRRKPDIRDMNDTA